MRLIITDTELDKGAIKLTFSLLILIFLFFVLVRFIPTISADVTQETENVTSNVTITKTVAISRSTNLTAGILFGTVNTNTNNNNATGNFNSTNHTQFWITIDSTTTVPIDLCIKVNDTLRSGTYTIANTNYHWSNSSSNTPTEGSITPIWPPTVDISTNWQAALNDSWNSGSTIYNYFRFALDVPSGTPGGTYTNEIQFQAVENTTGC